MSMRFHQKRFFAYPNGAPSLHTLSSVSSHSQTLVTTDRSVSILSYGDAGYSLHKLEVDAVHAGKADVVASAAIELPGSHQAQVVVAYAVGEALFLQVLAPHDESGEVQPVAGGGKFALEAAPTCMFSVQTPGTNGDVFYGVVVCCTDVMMAFGCIDSEKENLSTGSTTVCARLDNEQFVAFFPEFATFSHTILAVDVFPTPEKDQGWLVFGCTNGLVRVFHGQMYNGRLGGPFETKDLQLNGPVTSVALFPKCTAAPEENIKPWSCNLLVACAIGQAVVYEDVFNNTNVEDGEVLVDSDTFDSIFAGITADIDLDGDLEILLGTDSQVTLAYKEQSRNVEEDATKAVELDESSHANGHVSPSSPGSPHNIWSDTEPTLTTDAEIPSSSPTRRRKWQRQSRNLWDLETFGAIYSLLWRDINHDGVPELIIASSTGIYVYEADPLIVIQKLERVLSALTSTVL